MGNTIEGVNVRCACGGFLKVTTPLRVVPLKYGGKGTVIDHYKVEPCQRCSKGKRVR